MYQKYCRGWVRNAMKQRNCQNTERNGVTSLKMTKNNRWTQHLTVQRGKDYDNDK